ncbi:rRNA methyltransferase 1, mitochondrial-like [Stegodyphus dumicola]|uniref:rRNA methyltransferase 1, mitochondrial-like n=1 Tax=Stegodyphus dumicola TaxID=202533 RepID=UPI0015A9B741|nr:rRNA methyltransferase 1, mitochondrial-like [Stegodyphus dumicola]
MLSKSTCVILNFSVKLQNLRVNFPVTTCVCCITNSTKSFSDRRLNLKTNFAFRAEFRKAVSQNENLAGRVLSGELKPTRKDSFVGKQKKEKKITHLSYQGELLFGIHPVYLALLQRKRIFYQLFMRNCTNKSSDQENIQERQKIKALAINLKVPINTVDSKDLKYLVPGAVHQGVCLDVGRLPLLEWKENASEPGVSNDIPFWLVLDEILDPMNVGGIIRSAYYFGIQKLFVVRENSCRLSPVVSKASSGALEVINIYQIRILEDFIKTRKTEGWCIVCTTAYCDDKEENTESTFPVVDVSEFSLSKPTILILGNESKGVSSAVKKLCDNFISIYPKQALHKGIDSLNVSVAAGVILHSLSQSASIKR